MATLTIRQIDDDIKAKLRVRAAKHGRSMEAEVRDILAEAVAGEDSNDEQDLASVMHDLFAGLGWDGSTLPSREVPVRYVDFDE
jgi:plasmid stability protein